MKTTMRRIVAFNNVTADGYFAAADESLAWVVNEDQVDKDAASGCRDSNTILLGRRTVSNV